MAPLSASECTALLLSPQTPGTKPHTDSSESAYHPGDRAPSSSSSSSFGMQLPVLLIRGLGFFNDAYDLFVMNVVNVVLEEQYGTDVYTSARKSAVSSAALVGAVLGQLVCGALADRLGRRVVMIMTCVFLILGGLLCTCASGSNGSATGTLQSLVVARAILGFGIGGEYPLSAASAAEDACSVADRSQRVALTFSLQGLGALAAAVLGDALVHLLTPHGHGENDPGALELVWRLLFGAGVLPALVVVWFRCRVEETSSFARTTHRHQCNQSEQEQRLTPEQSPLSLSLASSSPSSLAAQSESQSQRPIHATARQISPALPPFTLLRRVLHHYGGRLVGTAGSWFLFDIVFYAQNLFTASMLSVVGMHDNNPGKDTANRHGNGALSNSDVTTASLQDVTRQNTYVALMALPGYYVAVYYIHSLGRKRMQLQGFACMGVLFLVLALTWDELQHHGSIFILLFGLALFFANFGPNTTTFVLPTEMFPTAIRASCHGVSAAMGKVGAAIGSYAFSPLAHTASVGVGGVFAMFAGICALAIPLTYWLVFDNPHSLTEMDDEYDALMLGSTKLLAATTTSSSSSSWMKGDVLEVNRDHPDSELGRITPDGEQDKNDTQDDRVDEEIRMSSPPQAAHSIA